ncbi:MAG TPA: cardiolipin synthase [Burkholderiales bacterium]|nr:cardiolipin synthase [Burkholderiales bacterium]
MTIGWGTLYLASEWVVRIAMLFYVPQRRSPAAARGWLLLIFFLPWPGLVLYILFGRAYLPRQRLEMQRMVSQLVRELQPRILGNSLISSPGLPAFFAPAVALAHVLADFGICRGNQIELLTDYQGGIDSLLRDIDKARHHVHLMYYIFRNDETGQRVARALIAAAQRGVNCRVLVDGYGSFFSFRRLAPQLRAHGVEAMLVMPPRIWGRKAVRLDLRNHRKMAVIDGRIGYVGSQNIVNSDANRGLTNEELVARILGPVVRQLQGVFLADRYYESERLPTDDAEQLLPEVAEIGSVLAQVMPSGPGYHHGNIQQIMIALIHAAERRVVLTTPYFIPDESFLLALRMAAERGVAVHLVLSRHSNKPIVHLAQQANYEELLDAGAHIHLYHGKFLHAKHSTIDDCVAIIGSSNLDIRSFSLNNEVSVLVYDRGVVAQLEALQARYFADATEVDPAIWRKRGLLKRTAQNVARLADTLL